MMMMRCLISNLYKPTYNNSIAASAHLSPSIAAETIPPA
jgi:hypothetical protein